jgi:hypothetical protein
LSEEARGTASQAADDADLQMMLGEEAWDTALPHDRAVDYAHKAVTYLGYELPSAPYETAYFAAGVVGWLAPDEEGGARAVRAESAEQMRLFRDLFGPLPFRSVILSPAWLTPTVVSLAQAAYEQQDLPSGHLDPARLAVLADALEEAGCTEVAILDHLRGPGPHVRGCWPVDLLTGRK